MVVITINTFWILTLGLNLLTFIALLHLVLVICRFGADAYWISALAFSAIGVLAIIRKIRSGTLMTWQDGLILLEDRLGLESALSSAQDGHADWPLPRKIPRLYQPRKRWLLLPLLAWGLALQVPVGPESHAVASREMPSRGKELNETIDKIKEQKLVDPKELEKLTQTMEELAAQEPKNWFSHESMEAMDGLQERLDAAIDANEQALNSLQDAFSALKNQPIDSSSTGKSELDRKMDEALGNLSSGTLPLDPQLMKQLRELSNSTGSEADAQKAMEALKGAQEGFKSLNKQGQPGNGSRRANAGESRKSSNQGNGEQSRANPGSRQSANANSNGKSGEKDGKPGECQGGDQASKSGEKGSAGVSRGPGEAPLNLFEKPPGMTSELETQLESENNTGGDADEVINIIRRPPEVMAPAESSAGEDITTQNGTASATWKDSLTPDEEETLRQVLK